MSVCDIEVKTGPIWNKAYLRNLLLKKLIMTIVQPLLQSWFEFCVFFSAFKLEYVKRKDSVPQTFRRVFFQAV